MTKTRNASLLAPARVALSLAASAVIAALGLAAFALFGNAGGTSPKVAIEVKGAPRLKVDREVVDLGQVRLGTEATVAFTLFNVGDRPLRFTSRPYVQLVEGC